jgi:hypothetical protein
MLKPISSSNFSTSGSRPASLTSAPKTTMPVMTRDQKWLAMKEVVPRMRTQATRIYSATCNTGNG